MIYIRADANGTIGTGHVMRCLSIAREIERQGEEVSFIIADRCPEELIKESGFSCICIDTIWNDLNQEIDCMLQLIDRLKIKVLLIDSYFVTEEYLKQLGKNVSLVYIDDLDSFFYPVNLLINYNIFADSFHYRERYQERNLPTKFILGCQYAPLREEFSGVKRTIEKEVKRILITSGGTDQYDVIGHLLKGLKKQSWFADVEYHVIMGKYNLNKEVLTEKWEKYSNIYLHSNVSDMSYYMKTCDVAVTAGGVTTYELMACGIPSVMYTLADNQFDCANEVSRQQLMAYAGDVRNDIGLCIEKIIGEIELLVSDFERRKSLSEKMIQMVDGNGCSRLVREILKIRE